MKPVRCDNASSWEVDDTFDNAQWKKCQTNITNEITQLYALCQSSVHMVSLGMSLQATIMITMILTQCACMTIFPRVCL